MRKKLLVANTFISVIYQIVVIVCGFILPKVILSTFGSEVNGLVNSITQFLSIISLAELGVGAVVSSALYGPLAEEKWKKVSIIISSAESFFGKIAKILVIYVVLLILAYPVISNTSFNAVYTGSLILIISINSFAQYYIGVVDNIILGAAQKAFIVYGTQAIAHLLNTIVCVIVMYCGAEIHLVKGVTAVIYLLRPLIVRAYIKRHYPIKRQVKYETEPLIQKWNAVAQHVSECVLDSTDIIILTLFSSLSNVSVYYVYNLVVYNLKNFFLITASSGVLSVLGQLYATNGKKQELYHFYNTAEWIIHILVAYLFGVAACLIVPFVTVYTNNINDADYIQPVFAIMITLSHASHCIRLPYFLMVKAAGHYKQTQNYFIISTIANIVISVILVNFFGLAGVAIGTLTAMAYQTIGLAYYSYKYLIFKSVLDFIKRIILDVVLFVCIFAICHLFNMQEVSYLSWFVLAVKTCLSALLITVLVNFIFDRKNVRLIIKNIRLKL